MASLLGSRAVSPELWWFAFSADIDIASAQDRLKYSFVGANQVMLHVLHVFLGDTANSVFVKTSPATGQVYTTTISGLLDSQGETVDDMVAELLPDVLPAYPPTGIISLSADGEGWGSKLRASTEYWSKLIGINGIVGAMVYPFAHSVENPADYELDTAVLGEPVSELAIRPIVMPPHASEFTADQTADLVVAVPPSRLLPEFSGLGIRNITRPGDDTITIIDGIAVFGEVRGWRRYRGMELMIARLGDPEDLIDILPYYPPGANDPNDPNYDPEAPEDGSANPPWWEKPALPDKRPFFPWDTKKPPAVELLVPGDFDPGFAKPCPYAPPDIVIPPVNVLFPEIDIAELELPAGDHTIIARIYNELNEYSERTLPLRVEIPVTVPGIGPIDRVIDVIVPVESHTEGEYTVDHNVGNVVQRLLTLVNNSGLTFLATVHIPQNGGALDIELLQDSVDSKKHIALMPEMTGPLFGPTLEYSLAGGPPRTIDFPLLMVSDEAISDIALENLNGTVPEAIGAASTYRVRLGVQSRTPFNQVTLLATHRDISGQFVERDVRDWKLQDYSNNVDFNFEIPGSEVIGRIRHRPNGLGEGWLQARIVNAAGRQQQANQKMPIPPQEDTGHSIEESVRYYVDEYLTRNLVYGIDSNKPPNKRPFKVGKAKLEDIDRKWPNGVPDSARIPDTPDFAGIDCSGFVYNVLDYVRLDQGLPSLDKVLGSNYTNSGQSLKDNKQFPELKDYYKPESGAGATPSPGNVRVKDLKAGDFMYGKPYNGGHYIMVEEVIDNEDGTYDVIIAHSGKSAGSSGKNGPHKYTIDGVSGNKGTHEIEEDDIVVASGGPSAHYEKVVLDAMTVVRRDKDLAEQYKKEENGGG